MDSAIIPLRQHGLSIVQSVDFFYPLVDDPYIMGKIALANVVSDIYATGVTQIDKITLIMSIPTDFTDNERDIVVPMLIKGYKDSAAEADCNVIVGNIAVNPWCIIGGVATSVCSSNEIIVPTSAIAGDVLILTKPLGTQLATNTYFWMLENSDNWLKIQDSITPDDVMYSYDMAVKSMSRLNKIASKLMHTYKAHAATDVTGFGLYGHAENLAKFQKQNVTFEIHDLPIIKNIRKISNLLEQTKLCEGKAVETSGGLLIALPESAAKEFCNDYKSETGYNCWVIGRVNPGGNNTVKIMESPNFIEVLE